MIIMKTRKIIEYFQQYNQQLQEFGGNAEIDTSGGLDLVMDSIDKLREDPFATGLAAVWNTNAYNRRRKFCTEVVLYFMATGEVPDYNVKEIVEAAKQQTLGDVANSFKDYSDKLKERRKILNVSTPTD